jgi:hypothetical protein
MSRKPRYIKLRLEMDVKMTDDFFKTIESDDDALQNFLVRNVFHNNAWKIRHKNVTEIPEVEYLAK